MGQTPLIPDFSRPATVLIEKISDAVGGIAKPWQMVREAKAQADVDRIAAESRLDIQRIEQRAMQRFVAEEVLKQQNIESIAAKAIPHLKEDSKPEELSSDWIANFFDKCRTISHPEMQELWSRVLAGQANEPGSYSRQTVSLLQNVDAEDAAAFARLCRFCWHLSGMPFAIVTTKMDFYEGHGLPLATLLHLESLGLIRYDSNEFYRRIDEGGESAQYFGETALLSADILAEKALPLGTVILTQSGRQLVRVCEAELLEGFFEFGCDFWRLRGIKVSYETSASATRPAN